MRGDQDLTNSCVETSIGAMRLVRNASLKLSHIHSTSIVSVSTNLSRASVRAAFGNRSAPGTGSLVCVAQCGRRLTPSRQSPRLTARRAGGCRRPSRAGARRPRRAAASRWTRCSPADTHVSRVQVPRAAYTHPGHAPLGRERRHRPALVRERNRQLHAGHEHPVPAARPRGDDRAQPLRAPVVRGPEREKVLDLLRALSHPSVSARTTTWEGKTKAARSTSRARMGRRRGARCP
jgi:hypothetical protein